MDCYICNPMCDNCKPKFIVCPECGLRTLLDLPKCPKCGCVFTPEMHEEANRIWRKAHQAAS